MKTTTTTTNYIYKKHYQQQQRGKNNTATKPDMGGAMPSVSRPITATCIQCVLWPLMLHYVVFMSVGVSVTVCVGDWLCVKV